MSQGERQLWRERLTVLRSVDLTGVAFEVNQRAARRLGVAVGDLRHDQRASAGGMKRTLLALVELTGESPGGAISYRALERRLGKRRSTLNRHVKSLREACLIHVEDRRRGDGAQLPNRFAPSWPNLIDVACSQGLQGELFDEFLETGACRRPPAESRPRQGDPGPSTSSPGENAGGPKGRQATAGRRSPQPKRVRATGQSSPLADHAGGGGADAAGPPSREKWEAPLPLWEAPPPIMGGPPSHYGRPPSHFSGDEPPLDSITACARAEQPSPRRGEGEREEEEEKSSSSKSRVGRTKLWDGLEAYGVAPGAVLTAAHRAGWSRQDVAELLAWFERQQVDGIRAFGPGLILTHVQLFPPGTRPDPNRVKPSEAYTRAKRDRDLRIAAERQQREDAELAARRAEPDAEQAEKVAAWEAKMGRHVAAKLARREKKPDHG